MRDSIKFLPLLILYICVVLIFSTDVLQGDQGRYVRFATNLSQGFYSSTDDMNLWNGPGYPIVLLPFILLNLPLLMAKLLNAIFLFAAIVYFYHTLCLYIEKRRALSFSYILGIYPPMMRFSHWLVTESLTFFLIAGFLFYFCRLYRDTKNERVSFILASCFLGYLALTKTAFGYVITAILVSVLFLYLWKRREAFKKTLLVYLFALILCLPYLYYTYSLTGRIFYWGNAGGASLYWMSNPNENELGDHLDLTLRFKEDSHKYFLEKLSDLDCVQRDDEFKKQAFYNIRHHPLKFLRNWTANIGRLLFSYPYSYTPQKLTTFFYLIPNMFIVVLSFLCLYPSYRGRKLIPYEIYVLLLFAFITFAGTSFFCAVSRYFSILVPFFLFWIFFTLTRLVKIEMRH